MGLRLKILLPLIFFASMLFAYLYGYWMPQSLANIETGSLRSIERHLDSVAEGLVPLLLGHQLDTVYENLDSLMKKNRDWIDIRLAAADGRTLYPLDVPPPAAAETRRGKDIHIVERRIQSLDTDLGSLILTVDFAPRLSDVRQRHWELMSFMLGMVFIFTATAGFVVDRLVRRPANLLARASQRLAEGDFDVPLIKAGDDEIGTLVDRFEDMRKAIREYRTTLQSAHDQLEAELQERKRAEAAISKAGAYNRSLIEASLDPLVTIGPDGRITDVNAATEAVTGYPREKLIGTDFSDYFTEPEKARAGYRQVFQEGLVRDYPLEIRSRDGLVTPVLYNASVYRDEGGQVLGLFAAARDITEQERAKDEIHKLNAELEQRVKERTVELEEKNSELERMNRLFVGRELKMIELKERLKEREPHREGFRK